MYSMNMQYVPGTERQATIIHDVPKVLAALLATLLLVLSNIEISKKCGCKQCCLLVVQYYISLCSRRYGGVLENQIERVSNKPIDFVVELLVIIRPTCH